MDSNWIIVYCTNQKYKIDLIKGVLEGNNVDCVIVDKQDSSYLSFGEIEVYTPKHYANKAKQLIKESQL